MRSQLSNEIFRDELLSLYQQKRSVLQPSAAWGRSFRRWRRGLCHSSIIRADGDAGRDAGVPQGKKVYGYLKKPVKAQVDAIVDELAKVQRWPRSSGISSSG